MLTNCQSNSAKKASNTNRHNLASNNMEYHKLSSTQTLHVINRKAALCINYAFQKIARYIELENF